MLSAFFISALMENKIITIIGGTGFIGRYLVKLLAKAGYTIHVIARDPEAALHLRTAGDVGQVVLSPGNLAKPESLHGKLEGSYAVINLVGILFERGNQNFSALHAQGAEKLAKMAQAAKVKRLIHLSSLGVDKAKRSKYARTKALGEKAVIAACPEATIIRPGVIFGPEDNFFNQFARMATLLPALPSIGGGKTRFQPVYVGDVALAIMRVLEREDTKGQIYELGGPNVYSFRELLEFICHTIHRKRWLLPLPFGIAGIFGALAELLPTPPLTRDQVQLLKYDNLVSGNTKTLTDLGIHPTSVEMVVPAYLERFAKKVA